MKKLMLINVLQSEECRIAILEDGVLEELYLERSSQESLVGNIYKGRIVNIEPSIQAAFVDFGIGRNGFLHVSDVDPAYYRHLPGFENATDEDDEEDEDLDAPRPSGRNGRNERSSRDARPSPQPRIIPTTGALDEDSTPLSPRPFEQEAVTTPTAAYQDHGFGAGLDANESVTQPFGAGLDVNEVIPKGAPTGDDTDTTTREGFGAGLELDQAETGAFGAGLDLEEVESAEANQASTPDVDELTDSSPLGSTESWQEDADLITDIEIEVVEDDTAETREEGASLFGRGLELQDLALPSTLEPTLDQAEDGFGAGLDLDEPVAGLPGSASELASDSEPSSDDLQSEMAVEEPREEPSTPSVESESPIPCETPTSTETDNTEASPFAAGFPSDPSEEVAQPPSALQATEHVESVGEEAFGAGLDLDFPSAETTEAPTLPESPAVPVDDDRPVVDEVNSSATATGSDQAETEASADKAAPRRRRGTRTSKRGTAADAKAQRKSPVQASPDDSSPPEADTAAPPEDATGAEAASPAPDETESAKKPRTRRSRGGSERRRSSKASKKEDNSASSEESNDASPAPRWMDSAERRTDHREPELHAGLEEAAGFPLAMPDPPNDESVNLSEPLSQLFSDAAIHGMYFGDRKERGGERNARSQEEESLRSRSSNRERKGRQRSANVSERHMPESNAMVAEEPREESRSSDERGRNRGRDPRKGRSGPMSSRGSSRKPLIQDIFKRGQEVIVQVIKESLGNKGPTLSTYISIPGRYLVLMPGLNRIGVSRKIENVESRARLREYLKDLKPPKGLGFIIRTAGEDQNKQSLENDLAYLLRLWQVVVRRIRRQPSPCEIYRDSDMITRTIRDIFTSDIDMILVDEPEAFALASDFLQIVMPAYADRIKLHDGTEPLFNKHNIENEIHKINQKTVPLPLGGSIVIEQTEALVAIDVNSGNFRAENNNAEETAYRMNLQAAREIARQLRLRDLGGVIVNDFIDMRDEKHRRAVEKAMRDAVQRDRARTKVLRMSAFGIVEMTRQRIRPSLKRSVYQECSHCRGTGHVKTTESMLIEVMRLIQLAMHRGNIASLELQLHNDVAHHLLNTKRRQIAELEVQGNLQVFIRGHLGVSPEHLELICMDENEDAIPLQAPPAPTSRALPSGRGRSNEDRRNGDDRRDERRDRGEGRSRSRGRRDAND